MTRSAKIFGAGYFVAVATALLISIDVSSLRAEQTWKFNTKPGLLEVSFDGNAVATYVYDDNQIPRPYFAPAFAPSKVQVTRNHPPIEGKDDNDHGKPGQFFHPGIWLAFSNVNGNDYWRLKAPVDHLEFAEGPTNKNGVGSFEVRNAYRDQQDHGSTVFTELCRYTFVVLPDAHLIVCDSAFISPQALQFGDEEEMGFGIRAATPMAVKHGGRLINSRGERSEAGVWGRAADWCDYGSRMSGVPAGIMIVPDPANKNPSRFHARNTGFVTANPFGQKVFGEREKQIVTVNPGDTFRLRFAVVLRSGGDDEIGDLQNLADLAHKRMAELPRPTVTQK